MTEWVVPDIPEPFRLNNLFQLDDGTWRSNIRDEFGGKEFGEGETPEAAIVAALAKEGVNMARTAGSKNKPKGEGAAVAAGATPKASSPKKVADTKRSALFEALKFVSVASRDDAGEYQAHVNIKDGRMIAFDGIIAAGCLVGTDDNISACPHTKSFMKAVERCGPDYAVTQLPNDRLSIRSGSFKAVVKCMSESIMPQVFPDAIVGVFNEAVRDAMITVGKLVSDTGTTVVEASVLLNGSTALATDRITMLEVWHGGTFPRLTIPKAFVNAIAKVTKKPVTYGVSENSLTVFFEDNSFLRTQLYSEQFPEVPNVLPEGPNGMVAFPAELWVGLEKLLPFVDETAGGGIFLTDKGLRTSEDEDASTYDVEGMLDEAYMSSSALKFIQPHCGLMLFPGDREVLQFFNDTKTVRGALALRQPPGDRQPAPEPAVPEVETAPSQGSGWNTPIEAAPIPAPAPVAAPAPLPAPPATEPAAQALAPLVMAQADALALYEAGRLTQGGGDWFLGQRRIAVDQIVVMGMNYWLEQAGLMSATIDHDPSLDVEDNEPDEVEAPPTVTGGWQT